MYVGIQFKYDSDGLLAYMNDVIKIWSGVVIIVQHFIIYNMKQNSYNKVSIVNENGNIAY